MQKECKDQGFSNLKVDGIAGLNTLAGCPQIEIGDSGTITKIFQEQLRILADGDFGSKNRQSIINYQASN